MGNGHPIKVGTDVRSKGVWTWGKITLGGLKKIKATFEKNVKDEFLRD